MLINRRPFAGAIFLAWVMIAGTSMGRVLQFPTDLCMGSVSVEDPCLGSEYMELGRDLSLPLGLDPVRVCLGGNWDFVARAQGAVTVPAGRNVLLVAVLQPTKADQARLPELSRHFLQDRVTVSPEDLSGLSRLGPDDLYQLHVSSLIRRRDAGKRVLEPISRLTGLRVLSLSQTGITSAQMKHLKPLRSLRALVFGREWSLANAGHAALKDLPSLEYLDCDTGLTDVGLKHLGQLQNLRWLRLRMGRIWGPGLAELAQAPRLERLCLWGTKGLTDRHISYLEGLTNLKSLTLWGTNTPLTDATLASIGKLTSLEELYFIRITTKFTSAGLAQLKNLKHLRKLKFNFQQIGAGGMRHLVELPQLESLKGLAPSPDAASVLPSFRHLKALDVNWVIPPIGAPVPPEVVDAMGRMQSLEDLAVMGGQWSQEDLLVFGKLTNLRRLRLGMRDDLGDAVLAEIGRLKELERLDLSGGAVSKHGLNHLNGLTKLHTLDVSASTKGDTVTDETPLDLSALTNLKTMELVGVALTDADLVSLAGMRDLEWLILYGAFTDQSLAHLRDKPKLQVLTVNGLDCATGEGLAHLSGLPSLRDLKLQGRIRDPALEHLGDLPSVWSLWITTDELIQAQTVARLRERLPAIEHIHVVEPPRFDKPPVRIRQSRKPAPRRRRR